MTEYSGVTPPSGWDVICYMTHTGFNADDPCYLLLDDLETAAQTFPDEGEVIRYVHIHIRYIVSHIFVSIKHVRFIFCLFCYICIWHFIN